LLKVPPLSISFAPPTGHRCTRSETLPFTTMKSAAAAKYTISGGPAIGQKLDIVCRSSKVASVYCSAVKNQVTIMCPNTKVNGFVMIPGSTHGCAVTLRGVTTKAWAITSFSTAVGGMALTTAHA
jgi:hypothetical protein